MEKFVRVFGTFEEADQADAMADAHLTWQERLRMVDDLREQAHPDATKQRLARVCRVTELTSS